MAKHYTVCPLDCPDACSLVVEVVKGTIKSVSGNPEHPVTRGFICNKGRRLGQRVYSPLRVLSPLVRCGPKGEGKFRPVSWDDALQIITDKISSAADTWGPGAVLPYSFYGNMGILQSESMDRRFFHRLGAPHLLRTYCSAAGIAGYKQVYGADRGVDPEDCHGIKLFLVWGANPAVTNIHQMNLINKALGRGAELIVIDPRRSATARRAHVHLQLKPGSDWALAMGMAGEIFRRGMADVEYLQEFASGWEAFREACVNFTLSKAAIETGLPEEEIRLLADKYAHSNPALIRMGMGMQHYLSGGAASAVVASLPLLTGAWRFPGGGVLRGNDGYFTFDKEYLQRPDLRPSPDYETINMIKLGERLLQRENPVQVLYVYNSNPAVTAPDQQRVLAGLHREDLFTVVHDLVITDTCRFADVVLPATSSFEHTDIYKSYWHLYLQLGAGLIEPVGKSLPNTEVFRRLAACMGFDEPCFQETDEEMIAGALRGGGPEVAGFSLEQLKKQPWVKLAGRLRFGEEGFPIPGEKAKMFTVTDAGAFEASGFPLQLITPHNRREINSTLGEEGRCPQLSINPVDAEKRGIAGGDLVQVYNSRGSFTITARVTEAVLPGVVCSTGCWWLHWGANSNSTTPPLEADLGRGSTYFANRVEVKKAGTRE